jgi:hypothetical protein
MQSSLLLTATFLFAAVSGAQPDSLTVPEPDPFRLLCIASMNLTEKEVRVGLNEHRIAKCAEERKFRELNAERIKRTAERQARITSQFRGRLREGKRFLSPENLERFDPDQEPTPYRAPAFSRRELLRSIEDTSAKEARQARSTLVQQRMKDARDACTNVPRSFYSNCVRETLRALGKASDFGEIPSTRKY